MKAKKGISLIVLVITIIVIIILAGAVILNLTKNNPMDSAKVAKLVQEKESIESATLLYAQQVIASTSGDYTVDKILEGSAVKTPADSTTDPVTPATYYSAIVTTAVGDSKTVGSVTVYPISTSLFKTATDVTLSTRTDGSAWYMDTASGKAYLLYNSGVTLPTYIDLTNTTLSFVSQLS